MEFYHGVVFWSVILELYLSTFSLELHLGSFILEFHIGVFFWSLTWSIAMECYLDKTNLGSFIFGVVSWRFVLNVRFKKKSSEFLFGDFILSFLVCFSFVIFHFGVSS